MTYCYICPNCDHKVEAQNRDVRTCLSCGTADYRRDWQGEGVGIGSGVRESNREHTVSGYRDLFLPTADDYRTPEDPSGQKGLRDWAETHGPAESNKSPRYPEMDKKIFATS